MNIFFEQNKIRWNVIPSSERISSKTLLDLDDKDLLNYYYENKKYIDKRREWEHIRYAKLFKGKSVIDLGCGMGWDGIYYSQFVKKWTFVDITENNINLVKKLCNLLKKENVDFKILTDPFNFNYNDTYDVGWIHGSLLTVPFELAKAEFMNLNKYLSKNAFVTFLMYPKERWINEGSLPFELWGNFTDGENTPWMEWYDDDKIKDLVGNEYDLIKTTKRGQNNTEIVNFDLIKK